MRIMILGSSKTIKSTTRISKIIGGVIDCKYFKEWPEESLAQTYDGVILHNRTDAKLNMPHAIFLCGSLAKVILGQDARKNELEEGNPRALWTNSYTMAEQLRERLSSKMNVKCMPKPEPTKIPKESPSVPEIGSEAAKTILWYWYPNKYYFEGITPQIVDLMNQLSDFRIFVISHIPKGVLLELPPNVGSHVKILGNIDIHAWRDKFAGMLRISNGLDFGRVTYQMQAYGKWVIYLGMKEPHVTCAEKMDDVPTLVRDLCSGSWDDCKCREAWEYVASNFAEKALQRSWVEEVKRVFG